MSTSAPESEPAAVTALVIPAAGGPDDDPPVSLERTRLLLGWLRAQRAVDQLLSELLAAGPGGERRVGSRIEQISELVAAAAGAFEAYRLSPR